MILQDPGLQPERTSQAWSRTGLAVTANALLLLRSGFQALDPVVLAAGGAVFAGCLALFVLHARHRRVLSDTPALPSITELRLLSMLTVLGSVGALGAVLRSW